MPSPFFYRPNSSGSANTGSTGKNYLSTYKSNPGNGDFETNTTTGWSLGTATLTSAFPSGAPTFGSGASGNLSIATTSTTPLGGTYSLNYVSAAATTAGNFLASDAFTIDNEDQAKVLTFKFYYSATVNPSNANWSGTSSNSFGVAIYDVTASAWIQPAGVWGMVQSSGVGYVTGTFQTTSTSTQYRLVMYNANATSGAITLKVDDFYVGPQTAPIGSPNTDWIAYTPTGSWSTNTTYTGWYKRVGDTLSLQIKLALAGAPTSASLTVNLPSGLTIDTTKQPATNTNQPVGLAWGTAAAHNFQGPVFSGATSTVVVTYTLDGSTASIMSNANVTQAAPYTFANGDVIYLYADNIPISGWSSNTQMSNDTDTRVVACVLTGTSTSITAGGAAITPTTVSNDTHGAFSSSTYTIPVSGFYRIEGTLVSASAAQTAGNAYILQYKKNGTAVTLGEAICWANLTSPMIASGSATVYCNATDTIQFFATSSATNTPSAFNAAITRLSGPAVVAATESVNARYYSSVSSLGSTGAPTQITYATKDFDTHNAYSGGTFTVPVSGKYNFNVALYQTATTTAANNAVVLLVKKNGNTISSNLTYFSSATSKPLSTELSDTIACVAGDTITVYAGNDATTPAISASNVTNYFSIARVGN